MRFYESTLGGGEEKQGEAKTHEISKIYTKFKEFGGKGTYIFAFQGRRTGQLIPLPCPERAS